jgi:oleandomycin transport system permease protein
MLATSENCEHRRSIVGRKGFEIDGLVKKFGRTTALFGFCLSWLTVFIGVLVKSADAVLSFSFIAFLPLQLGSSLAAPTGTLPGWLHAWADINPVTHVMNACRALLNGTPDTGSINLTLLWSATLFVIFCPLAVRAYGRPE